MSFEDDYVIALHLQKKFDEEASKRNVKGGAQVRDQRKLQESHKTLSLVDKSLEYLDPNPDIHALFLHFNDVFFWKKLTAVEVRWSPRMTSCAGICCYEGRGRLCSIRLSLPLLKLRPRKDLVETLLHEMIHAYLFVTNNNRDRNGHGPEFHKHMFRINQSAGTNITVFHSFHGEVRSYQQHWWQCQGPCRNRRPYFGMVRRAMNRAPGPSDFWWPDHQASCGGVFVKIREPDGFSTAKKCRKEESLAKAKGKYVPSKGTPSTALQHEEKTIAGGLAPKSGILGYFSPAMLQGKRDGERDTQGVKLPIECPSRVKPFVPFSGEGRMLGSGGKRGPSSKREPTAKQPRIKDSFPSGSVASDDNEKQHVVLCPVCCNQVTADQINKHLDACIDEDGKNVSGPSSLASGERWHLECPGCRAEVDEEAFEDHLDRCEKLKDRPPIKGAEKECKEEVARDCKCPTCGVSMATILLGEHLDSCLSSLSFEEDWN